jgi:hypothetical protein
MNNTPQRVVVLIAVAALILRCWLALTLPVTEITENMRVGETLAKSGFFGNPFPTPTGATAHVAPLYPAIIAAAILTTRETRLGFVLARCIMALVFCVFLTLLPNIASTFGFNTSVGVATALVFAFPGPPVFMWLEVTGQHETVLTAAALVVLLAATVSILTSSNLTSRNAVILGASWGLGMYVSPTLLLPMLAAVGTIGILRRPSRQQIYRVLPTAAIAFSLVVGPWIVRNQIVLGTPSFIRDNFGIELEMSNSDDAKADMRDNMMYGRSMTRHPYFNSEAALELRAVGEAEYYGLQQDIGLDWISEHPRQFASLTLQRIGLFFFPKMALAGHAYFYLPLFVLWVVGAGIFVRKNSIVVITLNLAVLAYALPHFLVQSSPRYSYPVLWLMTLFAAHAVLEIVTCARARFMSHLRDPTWNA